MFMTILLKHVTLANQMQSSGLNERLLAHKEPAVAEEWDVESYVIIQAIILRNTDICLELHAA